MSLFGNTCTIVNRCNKPVHIMFDGKTTTLPPRSSTPGFPRAAVDNAKNQNPIMGSEDMYDPSTFLSLVGVEGEDDCSPVEVVDNPQRVSLEPMKARLKGSGRQVAVIPGAGASMWDAKAGLGQHEADAVSFGRDA